jgi:hypothetical protein
MHSDTIRATAKGTTDAAALCFALFVDLEITIQFYVIGLEITAILNLAAAKLDVCLAICSDMQCANHCLKPNG